MRSGLFVITALALVLTIGCETTSGDETGSVSDAAGGAETAGEACAEVQDACDAEGATECAAGGVRTCTKEAASGCLVWGAPASCDDGNPCTDDSCAAAACVNAPNTATCDDGSVATKDDVCAAGSCAGTAYTCMALQCEESSIPNGTDCTVTPKAPGTACDDGDPATTGDACDAVGTCAGEAGGCTPTQCELTSAPGAGGCEATYKAAGTACDDGDAGTGNDVCDGAGACAGETITCTAGTCESDSVPNGTGCTPTFMAAGTACDDGDPATASDVCDGAGGCAGTAVGCTPAQCEATSVPNGTDCTVTFKTAGAACDDGDEGTKDDVCDGTGGCAGAAYECTPSQCEMTSTPNGTACTTTFKAPGTSCNDQSSGTKDDQCDGSGGCAGTGYTCTPAACQASSVPNGTDCTVTNVGAGAACDDGSASTKDDQCSAGGVCAGTAFACTPGPCDATSVPNGTDCTVTFKGAGAACNDGDPNTSDDVCDGSGGCAGEAIGCTPTQCQASSTPNGGGCDVVNKMPGAPCNDGNATTKTDVCDGNGACAGTAYTCVPDQCDTSSTPNGIDCTVVLKGAGAACNDGSATTKDDVCAANGTCAGTAYTCTPTPCEASSVPNGTACTVTNKMPGAPCNDGSATTKNDVCNGNGACSGTTYACTAGQCEVSSTPNGTDCTVTLKMPSAPCNDQSSSTKNDVCNAAGACAGTAYTCTPNECQVSSTPNGTDCTAVNKMTGASCTGGTCDGNGACQAAGPAGDLVINEVDYETPGTDVAEFIELKNIGAEAATLSLWKLEHVNGSNGQVVFTINLSDAGATLAPGAYLVIGNSAVTAALPAGVAKITFANGTLQNGSPDGVRLMKSGQLHDGVAWVGTMGGTGEGLSTVADLTATSLSRCPDGADTGDNKTDLRNRTPTPGAINSCGSATFDQVWPAFKAKCGPCHTTGSSGGHSIGHSNISTAYTQSQKPIAGTTIGALALSRVVSGGMPLGGGCSGNPDTDAGKSNCFTAAELQLLIDWVASGQPPAP